MGCSVNDILNKTDLDGAVAPQIFCEAALRVKLLCLREEQTTYVVAILGDHATGGVVVRLLRLIGA